MHSYQSGHAYATSRPCFAGADLTCARRGKREKYRRINFVRVGMRDRAIVNRRRSITEIASRSTKSGSSYEIHFVSRYALFRFFQPDFSEIWRSIRLFGKSQAQALCGYKEAKELQRWIRNVRRRRENKKEYKYIRKKMDEGSYNIDADRFNLWYNPEKRSTRSEILFV